MEEDRGGGQAGAAASAVAAAAAMAAMATAGPTAAGGANQTSLALSSRGGGNTAAHLVYRRGLVSRRPKIDSCTYTAEAPKLVAGGAERKGVGKVGSRWR
jgi:hypothetical protein